MRLRDASGSLEESAAQTPSEQTLLQKNICAARAYIRFVVLQFIESPIYSKQIDDLLDSEEHRQLQQYLLDQPGRGDLIKGAGGLRKLR
jgi:hypothetical protein